MVISPSPLDSAWSIPRGFFSCLADEFWGKTLTLYFHCRQTIENHLGAGNQAVRLVVWRNAIGRCSRRLGSCRFHVWPSSCKTAEDSCRGVTLNSAEPASLIKLGTTRSQDQARRQRSTQEEVRVVVSGSLNATVLRGRLRGCWRFFVWSLNRGRAEASLCGDASSFATLVRTNQKWNRIRPGTPVGALLRWM